MVLNVNAVVFHSLYWLVAYFGWLFATVNYHPSWTLRILCTAILVVASAGYSCFFSPRQLSLKSFLRSSAALIVIGVVAAIAIHLIYDAILGPDPRRFPLTSNLVMDTVFVLANSCIAGLIAWAFSKLVRRNVWDLKEPNP